MLHLASLAKWIDGQRPLARLQALPVLKKLLLMELRRCLNQALLATRERAGKQLDGVNAEDADMVLIVGMKMSRVMRFSSLREHSHDDPKEPREFRHGTRVAPLLGSRQPGQCAAPPPGGTSG